MPSVYSDTVYYDEDSIQVSYREGSLEINKLRASVKGVRVNKNGCWYVGSTQGFDLSPTELKEKLMRVAGDRVCGELAEAELFKGAVEVGKELPTEDEVAPLLRDLCEEAEASYSLRCEVTVTLRTTTKLIERDDGTRASEVKKFAEVEVGLLAYPQLSTPSLHAAQTMVVAWSKNAVFKAIEDSLHEAVTKARKFGVPKPLKPYQVGRAELILDSRASSALMHEISHLLTPIHITGPKLLGTVLTSQMVSVYDEPHIHNTPSLRFFDDEGVIVRRRALIEEGVVRDLHHTRATAKAFGSEPGSAYGLFTKPQGFHSSLIVKPGDWREEEMIEETKSGYLIENVALALLEEGYVRIIPQYAYDVARGELSEAVKIREVKVPFSALKTINAVSKDVRVRVSRERDWVVSEVAPYLRLTGFIS